jgi:hypothetical protein
VDDTGRAPGAIERVLHSVHDAAERPNRVRLHGGLPEGHIGDDAGGGGERVDRED